MRCVSCNRRVEGKSLDNLKASDGRCPGCGHLFVADPAREVFSDVAVRKAVSRVSADGTVRFLPEHLGYELQRGINARISRSIWSFAGSAVLLMAVLVLLANPAIEKFIGVLMAGAMAVGLILHAFGLRARPDVFGLATRYLAVNPSPQTVPPTDRLLEAERNKELKGLGVANQIVVCQEQRHAEFLIANEFALHHACPVIGPNGYLMDLYPGLSDRLVRGPAVDVFVLHDFTPDGVDFARSMSELPRWLGQADRAKLFDVGLITRHLADSRLVLRALTKNSARGNALFLDGCAEITGVRPALLIGALAQSLEDHQPLRFDRKHDNSSDAVWDSE